MSDLAFEKFKACYSGREHPGDTFNHGPRVFVVNEQLRYVFYDKSDVCKTVRNKEAKAFWRDRFRVFFLRCDSEVEINAVIQRLEIYRKSRP